MSADRSCLKSPENIARRAFTKCDTKIIGISNALNQLRRKGLSEANDTLGRKNS